MAVGTTIRVLVVDDHSLLRSGIAAVIEGSKDVLVVDEATNGQEAIEKFRTHRPDVTLMDLQMPVMNGIDAIVAIRKEFPNARFIVLTTYDGDVQALRALKAGATGGKISGAGGGGFMMFYCPGNTRYAVKKELHRFGGEFSNYQFTERGLFSWSIK